MPESSNLDIGNTASGVGFVPSNDALLRVRVARVHLETPRIRAFKLVPENGRILPAFRAGAHVDVVVRLPELAERSYSIASPPSDAPDSYLLAVLDEVNGTGGSAFMHQEVGLGDILEMSPPKNFFELADDGSYSVLIAGGIGVTPILAMAYELSAAGRGFEFHYAARSPGDMAFREAILRLCGSRATLYFDGGDPSRGIDLEDVTRTPGPERRLYVCGPKGMIEAVRQAGRETGWAEDRLRFEVFTPPEPVTGDRPIDVTIRSSGQVITVPPGKPILEALLEAGIDSDYDCRMGICGSCAVRVLDGSPDHRDSVLTDSEHVNENLMCTCVSWAKTSTLVLDH